jgi:hypothetical protein
VGDLICQFTGGPIPFILRPWREEEWKPTEIDACSRLIVKVLEWITRTWTRQFTLDHVNEEISVAVRRKRREETREVVIQHYTFVGECFVDGLMNKGNVAAKEEERQQVAFALH